MVLMFQNVTNKYLTIRFKPKFFWQDAKADQKWRCHQASFYFKKNGPTLHVRHARGIICMIH